MRAALLTTGLVVALASPAAAATVTSRPENDGAVIHSSTSLVTRVMAAPGEANRLEVTETADGIEVVDAGAPLIAGEGCRATSDGVRCAIDRDNPYSPRLEVAAGDGDDQVRFLGEARALIAGGAGADRLVVTWGASVLAGGPGADTVRGGAGDDVVDESDDDGLSDALDGGAGRDLLAYGGRTAPVSADLAAGTAGADGEADRIVGFENAQGGLARDVLRGDDGPNRLFAHRPATAGSAGDAASGGELHGAGGDDRLYGDRGPHVLDGGAGADRIDSHGKPDRVTGGPGRDTVRLLRRSTPDASVTCGPGRDRLHAVQPLAGAGLSLDCEQLDLEFALLGLQQLDGGIATFSVRGGTGYERPRRLRIATDQAERTWRIPRDGPALIRVRGLPATVTLAAAHRCVDRQGLCPTRPSTIALAPG